MVNTAVEGLKVARRHRPEHVVTSTSALTIYEGWNFNSGNYLFTTDTK